MLAHFDVQRVSFEYAEHGMPGIIREFNPIADGIANETIGLYSPDQHPDGIVINDGWL